MKMKKMLKNAAITVKHVQVDALENVLSGGMLIRVIMWSLLLLASIVATTYLIVNTVQQYNEHLVSSTFRYNPELDVVPFPTITLCPVNPFQSAFAMKLLADANVTMANDEDMNSIRLFSYVHPTPEKFFLLKKINFFAS